MTVFNDLFAWLFAQYKDYPSFLIVLEFIAALFGLISVLLVKYGKIFAYPIGLISTSLYVYLLWRWQLFGDMLINTYYTVMSVYGWLNWSTNQDDKTALIETTDKEEWLVCTVMVIFTFLFVGVIYYFKPFINNNFSSNNIEFGFTNFHLLDYTDMFTTGLFLVAMWLMAKRKIEHWLVWIVADSISIPLYFYKGMVFTSLQYLFFTMIAISAYVYWRKLYQEQYYFK